jgi:hypothetical protein
MILTVIEPSYFPSVASIAKSLAADAIVWADSFRFHKHGATNRTRIKAVSGPRWLTVPVLSGGLGPQNVGQVKIDILQTWQKNHRRTLEINYRNAPYFYFYWDKVEEILARRWESLSELDLATFSMTGKYLGMKAHFYRDSQLPQVADRTERVIAWLDACQCDAYLLEPFELPLIDVNRLLNRGFRVLSFQYVPQVYHQMFKGFVDSLSILDLLFNEGEQSAAIIKNGILAPQSFVQ